MALERRRATDEAVREGYLVDRITQLGRLRIREACAAARIAIDCE